MSIQDAVEFFRTRVSVDTDKTAFNKWEDVLEEIKKHDPKDGNYYMLATCRGTKDEARTRFLTHPEAMKTIMYNIEKSKFKNV